MKRFFTFTLLLVAVVFGSCSYDDTPLWNKVNDHEARIKALEELCQQTNTNIEALQGLVGAVKNADYITSVTPIKEGGDVIGYTITFAKSEAITIYNGTDGEDGEDGEKGDKGDPVTVIPEVGIKLDETDGIYYWTIDGKWLTDEQGNKIPAVVDRGEDGTDGEAGADGKDGVTPRLKIENDYWYVSYDEGKSWTVLSKATADGSMSADSIFSNVEVGTDSVTFTLLDGTTFTVAFYTKPEILFDNADVAYLPLTTFEVGYSIVGGDADTKVECFADGDWRATVAAESASKGKLVITPSDRKDVVGKVVVIVTTGTGSTTVKALTFEEGEMVGIETAYTVDSAGGTLSVAFSTNLNYEVVVDCADGSGWLTYADTRAAMRDDELIFDVAENPYPFSRFANVYLLAANGNVIVYFQVIQLPIPDNWVSLGEGLFFEDFISWVYGVPAGNFAFVTIEENLSYPGQYRMLNPFCQENIVAFLGGMPRDMSWPEEDVYVEINATDPDRVYVPFQPVGFTIEGLGEAWIGYISSDQYSTLEDGVITFPAYTLGLFFNGISDSGYFANTSGLFKVVLPDYVDSVELPLGMPNLTFEEVTDTSFTVSWSPINNAAYYRVNDGTSDHDVYDTRFTLTSTDPGEHTISVTAMPEEGSPYVQSRTNYISTVLSPLTPEECYWAECTAELVVDDALYVTCWGVDIVGVKIIVGNLDQPATYLYDDAYSFGEESYAANNLEGFVTRWGGGDPVDYRVVVFMTRDTGDVVIFDIMVSPGDNTEDDIIIDVESGDIVKEDYGDYYENGTDKYIVFFYADVDTYTGPMIRLDLVVPAGANSLTGEYSINDSLDVYTSVSGYVDESGKYQGSLYQMYQAGSILEKVPILSGDVTITEEDGGKCTLLLNCYDIDGNAIKGTFKGTNVLYQ